LEESREIYSIELNELDDLIRLVAFSHTPILHHLELKKGHMYFARVALRGDSLLVYYVVMDQVISGKYVVYNFLKGSIEFSDTVSTDTGLRYVSVLEVSSQNIFSEEMLSKLSGIRKRS
jgi:hypothetical protein